MKRLIKSVMFGAVTTMFLTACNNSKYNYETVEGDPMGVQMYTLKNGLKVYMSVNKEQPRIQTAIAVHAGAKNEPEESTGLAHYLEHVMFKGTEQFGTLDYAKEKPMLDEIERLYEVYRKTSDPAERKAIYHQIDSVSYEASKLAIPNEYDKLMATIGSDGSNAYTSYDLTCYVEDIPSNQIDNWAKVQADRFKNMVIRGFHTELEAVYEEYNGGLTEDWDKLHDTISTVLYPSHSYRRGIIGKQEHLKNPSITNIKKFFETYYVPNNMAICVSGDFIPDSMIAVIERYFGDMKPNESLKKFEFKRDPELKASVSKTVVTPQEEYVSIAWRFDGTASHQLDTLSVLDNIVCNGKAGLFDLDLNLKHKVLYAQSGVNDAADYSYWELRAYPMPGQTLDDVKTIVLDEIEKLRKGKFSKELMEAVINNEKLSEQKKLESNSQRVTMMVNAFINDQQWNDVVTMTDREAKISKDAVVEFANKHIRKDNYVVVYKRKGTDPNIQPVEKPAITPIVMNRDVTSDFVKAVSDSKVEPIEPVFLDFSKDITKAETANKLPVVYRQNGINKLFTLNYIYDMGSFADPTLPFASNYLEYVGTDSLTAEQVSEAFYRLGCSYNINVGNKRIYVTLRGLDENLDKAVALLDHLMTHARTDKDAWNTYLDAQIQARKMQLGDFSSYLSAMRSYLAWGEEWSKTQNLSNERLRSLSPDTLLLNLKNLSQYQHEVAYYGPRSVDEAVKVLADNHHVAASLKAPLANKEWKNVIVKDNRVFFVPFDDTMNFDLTHYGSEGKEYDSSILPAVSLYQEYFGGGMNSIVFQDMREKKALVYGANARIIIPSRKNDYMYFVSYAESQSDKLNDVVATFNGIINDMPEVKESFRIAKEAVIARLRTQRTTGMDIIRAYFSARDRGLDTDPDAIVYEKVKDMTLADVVKFQQKYVKGKPYHYGIVGKKSALDFNVLKTLGPVTELTPEQVFGY